MECLESEYEMADEEMEGGMGNKKIILIVAVVIIVIVALLFLIGVASLNYFGVTDIPGLPKGSSLTQVLVIGDLSLGERVVLDNLSYMLTYQVRDAASFDNTAAEEFAQYDLIIFDQSLVDKSVTVSFGEAIQKYAKKGGKMIVVLNSGIYQSVGFGGLTSTDVVGWNANFGNIMPVECVLNSQTKPSCADEFKVNVVGRIHKQIFDHPIMDGIDIAPPNTDAPYNLSVLDVQASEGASTVAYIASDGPPTTFPAIVEKKGFPLGTVVYFNYDPGMTPGILINTIKYLK